MFERIVAASITGRIEEMSRSGYTEYGDNDWTLIKYRGMVASAFRGKRGIEFLRSLRVALDAIPDKKLIAHELQNKAGGVCAIGAVGKMRGIDMTEMDAEIVTDDESLAKMFNISNVMVREVEWENDLDGDSFWWKTNKTTLNADGEQVNDHGHTKEEFEARFDEARWSRVSHWVDQSIKSGIAFRRERGWKDV